MIGYMIGGAVFARRWGYLLACIVMGTGYWLIIKQGLMPQQGISFAAHFGGLCAGLLLVQLQTYLSGRLYTLNMPEALWITICAITEQ